MVFLHDHPQPVGEGGVDDGRLGRPGQAQGDEPQERCACFFSVCIHGFIFDLRGSESDVRQ